MPHSHIRALKTASSAATASVVTQLTDNQDLYSLPVITIAAIPDPPPGISKSTKSVSTYDRLLVEFGKHGRVWKAW